VVVTLLCTRWWATAGVLATLLAIGSGILVNPLVQGTGALDSSHAATVVRHLDQASVAPTHGTWAADSILVDALLNGEGVNSVSSFNNPVDIHGWEHLDPHRTYEKAWNRFAYINFAWDTHMTGVRVAASAIDHVVVTIDPCSPRLATFKLRMIVSSHRLLAPCLAPAGRIRWMGTRYSIYRRV